MQRGNYGIEFDDEDGIPFRKLAWLLLLIPIGAIAVLVFRGCSHETSPAAIAGGDPLAAESYDTSGLPAKRGDRAPFFRGLVGENKPAAQSMAVASAVRKENPPPPPIEADEPLAPSPDVVAAPPAGIPASMQKQLAEVAEDESKDDLLAARSLLLALRKSPESATVMDFIERKLGTINQTLLFTDRPMPGKVVHKIVAGDLVGKVARMYNTTQDFIFKANGIENANGLHIGKELWVLNKPNFCLTIFKKHCSAVLTLNGEFFKRYTVGIGPAADVPLGTYALANRVKHPVYRKTGQRTVPYGVPGNILGTTWLGLSPTRDTAVAKGFGLHGTWVNASLGRACDDGRVRFSNADIEQLAMLLPIGTRVNVME